MNGRADQPSAQRRARWRDWLALPTDAAVLEEHRESVLHRTRIAALIAAVVMPVTIVVYFGLISPIPRTYMVGLAVISVLSVIVLLGLMRLPPMRRQYHLAFFLLVGVICSGIESTALQLAGGSSRSDFLFPYFLILFGIATLFPARIEWALAAALMCPISYVVGELIARGRLGQGRPVSDLLLLMQYALITVGANRVTTRTFFNEVQHRRALEVANAQLRELDQAKRDFFANVSHDLKTPLNTILGPVQAVTRDPDLSSRARRYLEMAVRGARRLDGMINDLLELARLDAGVRNLNRSQVDLRQLIGGFLETNAPYAASVGESFDFKAPEEPVLANVDADKIERVLANLVSNALKFSPPGSTVHVSLATADDSVQFCVRDEGPGIPAEEQQRIFARFARGSDGSSKRARGAGVGLAVVREFVELHGGTVNITSRLGEGATFTVTLPRGEVDVRAVPVRRVPLPAQTSQGPIYADARTPRLLLVEDDDEMRSFLSSELGRWIEVVAVSDGEAALRLATEGPDVVILDVNLPGINGVETCRRLRRHPATSRSAILVYSAVGDLNTRLQAFDAGADDFVHKPVDPLELRARIESLLRRSGRQLGESATLGPREEASPPH